MLRSLARPGRGWWLLLVALLAVVELGVVAWTVQLRKGMGASGFNDHAFWAVDIANLVTFIGASYGGAVVSAILKLTGAQWRAPLSRLAEGTAVVTVLVGGALIVPHLGHPERLWEFAARPNPSSPLLWDAVAIGTYTLGSIIFFALPLIPDLEILHREHGARLGRRARLYGAVSRGWVGAPRQRAVLRGALGLLAVMIIPLAVSVHSVLSWAFSLTSRPWWHESIWAPYFVVAALYSGVALVVVVLAAYRRAYHLEELVTEHHFVRLGYILVAFDAAYLYLAFADILPSAYVGETSSAAVFHELLVGHFAPWFWLFVVAGGIFPLLVVAMRRTRTVTGIVLASVVILPTMWLKRMLMVAAPSTYDRMTGVFGAYHFTWVSVSITLAAVAAIPLLLMLLFQAVPLLAIDEIEEAAGEGAHAEAPRVPVRTVLAPTASRPAVGVARKAGVGVLLVLVTTAALALLTGRPAHAATVTPRPTSVITLTGVDAPSGVRLVAKVTDPAGRPVAGATVRFFSFTTEFGPDGQQVPIGSAATDQAGVARVTYRPPVAGVEEFVATYQPTGSASASSGKVAVRVTSARSPYRPAPPKPFSGTGKGLVGVLLVVVVGVQVTLVAQVVRVVHATRAAL